MLLFCMIMHECFHYFTVVFFEFCYFLIFIYLLVCLDEAGFAFVQWCINFIESKGLMDQGLYRLVGVNSKVAKLTQLALGKESTNSWDMLYIILYLLIYIIFNMLYNIIYSLKFSICKITNCII